MIFTNENKIIDWLDNLFDHNLLSVKSSIVFVVNVRFLVIQNFEFKCYFPNHTEFNSVLSRMLVLTNTNVDGMRVQNETWAQQLKDAMNVNGGDIENASAADYVMHFLTFGFKVS